ncbi:RNA polymerase sigma factor [Zunongwangia sp. F363]|uniref:RNA polymerase sigma factor n=1 Tax=Autumnicola tepida TaxID=3075595 RepID=A0ABU3CDI7_9FLAO|nr:RNA polymerase sigma factor [Zunongwangia sp. F363]MDT0644408.1 RNA polymerase sigma factor [Zunongwangia sp. F363]
MNQQPDQYFIEKAMHGDTRAFGVLVERYQDYIFTIVYRMLKVREEAEEVAQDVFLKAFEALPGFRGDAKFSSWLYRIAYRKTLDRIRKNSRFSTSELIEEITEDDTEKLENGLEIMLQEERSEIIQNCILKLPEQESAIITLFYFEEQSVKEIAAITGLTQDNIKVKLYRSRKALFSLLKKYMQAEIPEENGKAI